MSGGELRTHVEDAATLNENRASRTTSIAVTNMPTLSNGVTVVEPAGQALS